MKQESTESANGSSNKKRVYALIGVGLFVCGWMFGLGVLVGRGTAPVHFDTENLQKELTALKEAVLKEENNRFPVSPDAEDQETQLDFYEALRSTRERIAEPIEAMLDKESSKSQAGSDPPKDKPVAEPKKVRPPVKAVGKGQLTVQVASLKDSKVADQMIERLIARGYPAYRTIGKVPGRGIWYRVRIGAFKDKSEAKKMVTRLRGENIKGIILNR